jgi:hypothetical protein
MRPVMPSTTGRVAWNHARRFARLAAVAAFASLVACTGVPAGQDPVTDTLDPGAGVRALATWAASGVQVYECRSAASGALPGWVFVAPEAELFDAQGRRVGNHGPGPYWAAVDGSRIVGTVIARAAAYQAGNVPWLLLAARSTGTAGTLSQVTHVQRIHTAGGSAPAAGCAADTLGHQARVPYRADYRLFVPA